VPQRELLRTAENELQKLRGMVADAVAVIHDPRFDYDTRRAIAQALNIPEPATQKGAAPK
jgi:hypothetical protein